MLAKVHESQKVWDSGIGLGSWVTGLIQAATDTSASPLVAELRTALIAQECKLVELGKQKCMQLHKR